MEYKPAEGLSSEHTCGLREVENIGVPQDIIYYVIGQITAPQ